MPLSSPSSRPPEAPRAPLSPEALEATVQSVVRTRDHRRAHALATTEALTAEALDILQEVVLTSGTSHTCFAFARDVPGASLPRLQERVLQGTDLAALVDFAGEIPGAEVSALQECLELTVQQNRFQGAWLAAFHRKVPGADRASLERTLLAHSSPHGLLTYVRDIPQAPVLAIQEKLLERGTGDDLWDLVMARSEEVSWDPLIQPLLQLDAEEVVVGLGELAPAEHLLTIIPPLVRREEQRGGGETIQALQRVLLERGDVPPGVSTFMALRVVI